MSLDLSELYDRLYRFCYFRLRKREQAQDIVQESFTRYIDRYGKLDEKSVPVLYTIARNLCIDHFRRYREQTGFGSPFPEDSPASPEDLQTGENRTDELITRLAVQRALSGLPDEEAEVLLLVITDGFSVRDTGKILGISRFAVYRRLREGKKHLREGLRSEGLEDRSAGRIAERREGAE